MCDFIALTPCCKLISFLHLIFDIPRSSASHDVQTYGVPPLANEFCLLRYEDSSADPYDRCLFISC